jgi:hypothetical protein
MRFLEIIIENSTDKLAKLYKPAYKASQNPENGITIQNKSAYHVIKDCAYIAHLYLPLYCFENYTNPISQLKGKFKKSEIEEFVKSVKTQKVNQFLLNLILQNEDKKQPIQQFSSDVESNDPYGEYGLDVDIIQKVNDQNKISDDSSYIVSTLCDMFDAN